VTLGLRLCQAMSWFWYAFGYTDEGRRWLRHAVAVASVDGGPELATAPYRRSRSLAALRGDEVAVPAE